jgi:hypothetical protein
VPTEMLSRASSLVYDRSLWRLGIDGRCRRGDAPSGGSDEGRYCLELLQPVAKFAEYDVGHIACVVVIPRPPEE